MDKLSIVLLHIRMNDVLLKDCNVSQKKEKINCMLWSKCVIIDSENCDNIQH